MATTHDNALQSLYVAYFNRPADPDGLAFYAAHLTAGNVTIEEIAADFAQSSEYKTEYSQSTNEAIVDRVYQNLFGHPADAGGKKLYADALTAKTMTVDEMVAWIARGAQGTDAEAFEAKVTVATEFTNLLATGTEAEIDAFNTKEGLAAAKALISTIKTDEDAEAAIDPTALAASIDKVVDAGTPFTLGGAMAKLLDAQEAKSEVLADLAEEDAVAEALEAAGVTGTPTDAQVEAAIKAVQSAAATAADAPELLGSTFSKASTAMQAALIADRKVALNAQLSGNKTELANANTAANAVDNLTAAVATYTEAKEVSDAAAKAAALTLNAENAALTNLATLNEVSAVNVDTTTNTVKVGADIVIVRDAADKPWKLAPGVTEANTEGVTAAVAAMNANVKAQADASNAATVTAEALLAADILDATGTSTALATVAAKFAFTSLEDDELPTLDMIRVEEQLFEDRIDTLDAAAKQVIETAATTTTPAVYFTDYADYIADLKADVGSATATSLKGILDAAVSGGFITSADRTAITTAAGTGTTFSATAAAAVVDSNNWAARADAFDAAVSTLIKTETNTDSTAGVLGDDGIGNLAAAVITAEGKIAATEKLIADLADAVAAYNEAQALSTGVTAAQKAITAATKVITDEGFAAPVVLKSVGLNLSTSKDDIFMVGSGDADAEVRSFGVQGEDTLYVGTSLKYNNTVIGSGTGETDLENAGDNAVLEFFLNETATGVEVIIENKAFGSESGADADLTTITLVGVDLADITVSNGFITVG